MMGVCRGKLSEGIDFSDDAARCVIMVGIPYPQMNDPNVIMKKHYLDSKKPNSGSHWYNQEASRSVNQSIGRVIRHINDFGIIVLADERFTWSANQRDLPGWVKSSLIKYPFYRDLVPNLTSF
jgi:Rad3-related DNA helicase